MNTHQKTVRVAESSLEPAYNNRVAKAHNELQQFFAKFEETDDIPKPLTSEKTFNHV